jgi:hypothetical protein
MKYFRERGDYPIFYVVDRVANRDDVVVLIVDILSDDKNYVKELVSQIFDNLSSHNIKVLDYRLGSYIVPHREVWRLVAMVAVNQ